MTLKYGVFSVLQNMPTSGTWHLCKSSWICPSGLVSYCWISVWYNYNFSNSKTNSWLFELMTKTRKSPNCPCKISHIWIKPSLIKAFLKNYSVYVNTIAHRQSVNTYQCFNMVFNQISVHTALTCQFKGLKCQFCALCFSNIFCLNQQIHFKTLDGHLCCLRLMYITQYPSEKEYSWNNFDHLARTKLSGNGVNGLIL